jgi:large subunit ribosomal protein L13
MTNHTIDAKGKKLGRIASEAAKLLMGKNRTDFARNVVPVVAITITNVSLLDITEKKKDGKVYAKYSGYPGGFRTENLGEVIAKKGAPEALRKVIYGMLPKNKLRSRMIKNLKLKNSE